VFGLAPSVVRQPPLGLTMVTGVGPSVCVSMQTFLRLTTESKPLYHLRPALLGTFAPQTPSYLRLVPLEHTPLLLQLSLPALV